jgi:Flp pilus assembly pilin Flp
VRIVVGHAASLATTAQFPWSGDIGSGISGSYWRQLQGTPHTRQKTNPERPDMRTLLAHIRSLAERENGQTMAEYSIVLAVITVGAVTALVVLGSNISDALNSVAVLV